MPVILMQKDLFTEAEGIVAEAQGMGDQNYNVRRPFWGLRPKTPTFAFLSVFQDLGNGSSVQPVSILDSSAPGGFTGWGGNHNFILQNITENRQEKVQIIETFGDHFAFFYGQKPILLSVRGILFNSSDFNWKNEFMANYDRFLRGTKCVENKTRVFLGFDDVLAQGYLLNVSLNYDKDMPLVVPFSFNILLSKPPLDLSSAAAPLDNPNPSSQVPWTYRTLEADTGGWLPEYISDDQGVGLTYNDGLYAIGVDGQVTKQTGQNGNTAGSTQAPNGTADWVSGTDRVVKQWKDEEEALHALNVQLTAAQTGEDAVTVAQALRTNPAGFQLGSRDSATLEVLGSLSSGVLNSAAVVDDPDLG